ncbi:MAG: PilN domain-containing protein [Bacillota bacterium]
MILNESISNLTRAAEPLKAKAAEAEQIITRSELEKELSSQKAPWSGYLQELLAAAERNIFITTITFNPDRSFEIKGNSGTLQAAADYKRNIDNLSFTKDVELTSMTMNSTGRYDFQINAHITAGKEVVQD